MKVKVFSMVGISRYETEDETYHDVGVYGSLLEAQKAMQDNYNEEMNNFDEEKIMKEKTILEFNFGDSGCESLTVLVCQNLNQLKIDEIEDAISSYTENSETYLIGEQLVKDVLGSFNYDFEILFPDKVFDI